MSMPTTAAAAAAATGNPVIVQTSAPAANAPKASITETIKGYVAAIQAYFIAKYTWVVSKLPTRRQVVYGLVACTLIFGFLAYMGSQDGGRPEAIVENARQAWAPLASADDGVAKMSVAARDAVDSGFDKLMSFVGL